MENQLINILLVDDEPANLLVLKMLMADWNVNLIAVASGEEALKHVLRTDFAVILLDVLMPTMGGFETARLIRSRPRSSCTPIIFVTAAPDEPGYLMEEAYALGAVDYLRKPVNATIVRAKVNVFVDLYRKTENLARLERERTAAALNAANQRIRLILDNARDFAFIVTDTNGRITEWEGGAESIVGWPAEEVVGRPLSVIFTSEDVVLQIPETELARAKETGRAQDKRWHVRKDGSQFFADGVLVRLNDDAGILHGYTKIFRDGTAIWKAEQALRTSEAELRASEERVRLATDAAALGIWMWDGETGRLTWENERMYSIVGLSPLNPPENPARFLACIVHREDVASYRHAAAASSETGAFHFEGRIHRTDGELRWIEVIGKVQTDDDGMPLEMLGTMADITERKSVEEDLRRLAADLSKADRRKTEFLATLAHELRNPLAPIRTGLEVMRLAVDKPEVVERTRGTMERQVEHMVHLVDDLLDVARITHGNVQLNKQFVYLETIVSSAVEASLTLIESASHELTVNIPQDPVALNADPIRLSQVLLNLLLNAAKFTPDGGKILLSAHTDGDEVIISVRDTGIGIPAESLPLIFEMFSQVKQNMPHAQAGLGIGLALVRSFVELHGGTVTVASPGTTKGSTFTLRLPLAVDIRSEKLFAALETGELKQPEARCFRLLLVDDNTDAAETLGALLEIAGHTIQLASDGYQAIELAAQFEPDVIFLDIGMPGMSGYDVALVLRKTPGLDHVLLVALTGWGAEEDRALSKEAGFDEHLTKPASLAMIKHLLSSLAVPASRLIV